MGKNSGMRIDIMNRNTIISLAMLYALWQSSRKDLLDLIRPFVLYAVGNTLKLILLLYVIIWKESWDTNPSKLLS